MRDEPLGVLGTIPGSVQHALLVRQWSDDVTFFAHRYELADGRFVARTAVFVRPDLHPHPDGLLLGLGCAHDEAGFVITDPTGRTSSPGVWAAGNVADPQAQVITAAGAGSAAAINNDLVQADIDRAVEAVAGRM